MGGSIGLVADEPGGGAPLAPGADTDGDGVADDTGDGSADGRGPGDPGDPGDPAAPGAPVDPAAPPPPDGADGDGVADDPGDGDADDGPTATTRPPGGTPSTTRPTAVDLTVAQVDVPGTAEPSADACGDAVSFAAGHLVDGAHGTAWRMDGDGSGASITLTLAGHHRVLSVGLVPGYADVDACDGTDRFPRNRRITEVTWEFDGGRRVTQRLADAPTLQRIDVDAPTRQVTLHIEGVTADPERDFTAISELAVRGV